MKLAIIGSRNFDNYPLLVEQINALIDTSTPTTLISGGAKGADSLAKQFADEHDLPIIEFKPDYKRHNRAATFIRNRAIVDNADVVLTFWDGKSTGTKYTLDYANKQQKTVYICHYDS